MTATVVNQIKYQFEKGKTPSRTDVMILLAVIDAYERQVEELKAALQTEKAKAAEEGEAQS